MTEFKAPPPKHQQQQKELKLIQIPHEKESKQIQEPSLPYDEPDWSLAPSKEFHFEIIKNGAILGKSGIISTKYLVAGTFSTCGAII